MLTIIDKIKIIVLLFFIILCLHGGNTMADSPKTQVKLLFIHHSVGGRWLAHDYGGLVNVLNKNNYYVNDVTYGWQPKSFTDTLFKQIKRKILNKLGKPNKGAYGIGNRTGIGQWPDWFLGPDSGLIMSSIYTENLETDTFGDHSNKTSDYPLSNPDLSAENQIIMFKSCYPDTLLKGSSEDPASKINPPVTGFTANSEEHTVSNAKRIFNDLLFYFGEHPDKFFVIVTTPPRIELPYDGKVARGFSNWLVHGWRKENSYNLNNVMVFDLFNVLTSGYAHNKNDANKEDGNHHRLWNNEVQHIVQTKNHTLVYPRREGNNHPSPAGLQKATQEFVPLLNYYYAIWQNSYKK